MFTSFSQYYAAYVNVPRTISCIVCMFSGALSYREVDAAGKFLKPFNEQIHLVPAQYPVEVFKDLQYL